ncbi:MAG TPA: tetratricopeptide repeat protein [Polyangia bacterium]|nr:tetratricopeptide repeat protein [Polyangia bacterium]
MTAALLAVLLAAAAPASRAAARPAAASREPRKAADASAALRTGRYADALQAAVARLTRAPEDRAATLIAARAEMALGRTAEARRRLEAANAARPDDLPVRDALMRLYEEVGDRAALAPLIDASYADWNGGHVDRARPADLLAIATAARLDDNWKDANQVLRDAARADPRDPAPNLDWGLLLLTKHNASDAEASFRQVLKVDPDNPEAHVGLARAAVDDRYDAVTARAEIAAALAVNPAHAGALALRAELGLDGEDFAAARADVAAIRRLNPNDRGAFRVEAAAARLLDDAAGYAQARDSDLAVHPHDGQLFAFVADALARQRRYEEARAVAADGVAADPGDAACLSTLAVSLLRLGDEAAGVETLRRAWKRDPYDRRTYNLLDLYEKVIPADTVTVSTAHLQFRVPRDARVAVQEVVGPYLEARYRDDVIRYGFEPRGPVTFELFADPRQFAVRTTGLPAIGVSAVCFGRVITSESPTNHAFNWGMVLTHELAHVFAIELSRSRVPRWFTEGLSEVEAARARSEWTRHDDADLYGAWRRGEIPSLADLSHAFLGAHSGDEAGRAYALAAEAVGWLERRFGFGAVRAALVAYGRGERGARVLEQVSGMPIAELDRAFREDLARRLDRFASQYVPTEWLGPDVAPDSAPARGIAAMARGELEPARNLLARARALPHPSPGEAAATFFLAGDVALARRDADAAVAALQGLLGMGPPARDGYDVQVRLALAELHRRDRAAAEAHLRRALTFDARRVEPHALLAELLGTEQRVDDQLTELEAALRLDPHNDRAAKQVVFAESRRGHTARVIEFAPIATFIDPASPDLYATLGRALAASGKRAEAAAAFERALVFQASDPVALHLQLAALYDGLGERARAAAHRAAAGQ